MSQQFNCEHCDKPLISIDPGRVTMHGPLSIRSSALDGYSWVECPHCGRETRLDLQTHGLRLPQVR